MGAGIENELKYILQPTDRLAAILAVDPRLRIRLLLQGYIGHGTRLRAIVDPVERTATYVLSAKRHIEDGPHAGMAKEKERVISRREFADRWVQACPTVQVLKTRMTLDATHGPDGAHWDIDFLRNHGNRFWQPPAIDDIIETARHAPIYFALAEAEMPVIMARPRAIPHLLAGRILHEVPRGAKGYGNKKLADPLYAQRLLATLVAGHGQFDGSRYAVFHPGNLDEVRRAVAVHAVAA